MVEGNVVYIYIRWETQWVVDNGLWLLGQIMKARTQMTVA